MRSRLNQREIIVAEGMEEAMGEMRRTQDQLLDQVARWSPRLHGQR